MHINWVVGSWRLLVIECIADEHEA